MIVSRNELKQITGCNYYNGDAIHSRFAYDFFRKKTLPIGNIVAFRAPMEVLADGMIDKEDMISNDFIYSEDAINFIWEIPMLDNAFGATCFQRLFNTQVANLLHLYINKGIEVRGDDLMVHDEFTGSDGQLHKVGKCSVSITFVKDGASLGHTAINVDAGSRAPGFAYSTKLSDTQTEKFMEEVIDMFYQMVDDIFITTTKIIMK